MRSKLSQGLTVTASESIHVFNLNSLYLSGPNIKKRSTQVKGPERDPERVGEDMNLLNPFWGSLGGGLVKEHVADA